MTIQSIIKTAALKSATALVLSTVSVDAVVSLGDVPLHHHDTPLFPDFLVVLSSMVSLAVIFFSLYQWLITRQLRRALSLKEDTCTSLRETLHSHETFTASLPFSIFQKDRNGNYLSVNATFLQEMHLSSEEVIGHSDIDIFATETAIRFRDEDCKVMESKTTIESTCSITVHHTTRWIRVYRAPLEHNGTVTGVKGMFSDISRTKRIEESLLAAQHFNESVLKSTLNLFYIYDLTTETVVYTTPRLSSLLGYSSREISGMQQAFHNRLVHPDDIHHIAQMFSRLTTLADDAVESIGFRVHDTRGKWFWFQGQYTVFSRGGNGSPTEVIGTLHDITERVKAENDLKSAFDRAQRYLDIVETVIVALDRNGCITLINRKGLQLLDKSLTDVIGSNWFDECLGSDRENESTLYFDAINAGSILQLEYHENTIRTSDGAHRNFAWHNSLLTEENGRITGMLCAGEDITLRKEADSLLQTDKLRQQMLLTLNQLPDPDIEQVMDYALDTAIILTNSTIGYLYFYNEDRQVFNLYSWSRNVMESCTVIERKSTYQLSETGLWGEAVRQRKAIITNDYTGHNPLKRGLPEGHVTLSRFCTIPVFDEGNIVAVVGVSNKATPYTDADVRHLQLLMDGVWKIKKRIEIEAEVRLLNEELEQKVDLRTRQVKKAHDELERFFSLTPDLLCIATIDGNFIRCNNAWEQTLGYPPAQLENRRFLDLVHPDDLEKTLQTIKRLESGAEVIDFTNRYRCRNGSYRWIEWRSNAIGPFIYAAARDITEKKKNEDMLIRAKNEADRANKAKTYFLANMSHEIRTPLNAVIGYSELLSSLSTEEKSKRYIESITLAGRNLLRLINDILDLSKIEANMMSMHYEPVDLHAFIYETANIFSFEISEKNLTFGVAIQEAVPRYCLLDEVRLRQILLNLLGNAVKFTEEGFIRIHVDSTTTSQGTTSLFIKVSDSGRGINEEESASIFEAFHQQKGQSVSYGGTGLGLAICKKLVEIMNGSIHVESAPDQGSTFTVTLRDVAIASVVPGTTPSTLPDTQKKSFEPAQILIVDDIPSNRDTLSAILTDAGLTVLTAQNGEAAIELTAAKKPKCIIMDLIMPKMDGITAAHALKSNPDTADIPLIALTSSDDNETNTTDLENLFVGKLTKPVSVEHLFTTLSNYLPPRQDDLITDDSTKTFMLPDNLIAKARDLLGAVRMDDIRAFALDLTEYGVRNNITPAEASGKQLLDHAEHFDIEAVRRQLRGLTSSS